MPAAGRRGTVGSHSAQSGYQRLRRAGLLPGRSRPGGGLLRSSVDGSERIPPLAGDARAEPGTTVERRRPGSGQRFGAGARPGGPVSAGDAPAPAVSSITARRCCRPPPGRHTRRSGVTSSGRARRGTPASGCGWRTCCWRRSRPSTRKPRSSQSQSHRARPAGDHSTTARERVRRLATSVPAGQRVSGSSHARLTCRSGRTSAGPAGVEADVDRVPQRGPERRARGAARRPGRGRPSPSTRTKLGRTAGPSTGSGATIQVSWTGAAHPRVDKAVGGPVRIRAGAGGGFGGAP